MVGGQCIDLDSQGKTADLDLLWKMDQGKTVALISAACQMGCIAAGAGEKALENARRYAEGVGMAFQIRDDILDVLATHRPWEKTWEWTPRGISATMCPCWGWKKPNAGWIPIRHRL